MKKQCDRAARGYRCQGVYCDPDCPRRNKQSIDWWAIFFGLVTVAILGLCTVAAWQAAQPVFNDGTCNIPSSSTNLESIGCDDGTNNYSWQNK